MPDRWPPIMKTSTLAEYLEVCEQEARRLALANNFTFIQLTERGDRKWLRESVDLWIAQRAEARIKSPKAS